MKNETNTLPTWQTRCTNCGFSLTVYCEEALKSWNFCSHTCQHKWDERMNRAEYYGIHR